MVWTDRKPPNRVIVGAILILATTAWIARSTMRNMTRAPLGDELSSVLEIIH